MTCEKCGVDAPIHYCDVDGFGYSSNPFSHRNVPFR